MQSVRAEAGVKTSFVCLVRVLDIYFGNSQELCTSVILKLDHSQFVSICYAVGRMHASMHDFVDDSVAPASVVIKQTYVVEHSSISRDGSDRC